LVSLAIHSLSANPVHEIRYLNAARRGGTETMRLPILRGIVHGLPEEIDAILATSDLQGIVPDPRTRASTLLGVAVASVLEDLGFEGVIPRAMRTGVLLAGDLYSVPDANRRGGYGDVADVWSAFAGRFAWVAGVAGNHDDVTSVPQGADVHVLDTEQVTLAGTRVAGVGLISGDPARRGRRDEEEQLARIELVAEKCPEILILHEGPQGNDEKQPGHDGIRAIVERFRVGLTVCGHVHWDTALASRGDVQILNVDARVVVLVRT
jgi:Icc-related predicted phosphoesterase